MEPQLLVNSVGTILSILPEIIKAGNGLVPEGRERPGGYLRICRDGMEASYPPLLLARIGEPAEDRLREFSAFTEDKISRLVLNPSHVSGCQTEDEGKKKYRGSIRVPGYLLAISGFYPHLDEALCIWVARRTQLLLYPRANELALFCRNEIWSALTAI